MCFNGQSRHFIRYMSLFSYLFVCEYRFIMFYIVFCVLNSIFVDVSSKSFVILFVSFPILCCIYCCAICFLSHIVIFLLHLLFLDMFVICLIGN
jgi:hypothetical protein